MVAACTVFFRVEEVTVEGNERYSQEQILSVASVEMGANMILTPGEQIAQRIYRALPYVDHVEVQKRFPTTLKMVITESQPVAVITGAASAWIVDAKGKLLEQADETQAQEYTKVTGLELLEPEAGRPGPDHPGKPGPAGRPDRHDHGPGLLRSDGGDDLHRRVLQDRDRHGL